MLSHEYERKSECIEIEGFLKGFFWCETDDRSRFSDVGILLNIVRGLSWPYDVFMVGNPAYASDEFNDPESPIPTMFLCSFIGATTGTEPDAAEVLVDSMVNFGIEDEKIDLWIEDAKLKVEQFVDDKKNTVEFSVWYWEQYCSEAFEKMKTQQGG